MARERKKNRSMSPPVLLPPGTNALGRLDSCSPSLNNGSNPFGEVEEQGVRSNNDLRYSCVRPCSHDVSDEYFACMPGKTYQRTH